MHITLVGMSNLGKTHWSKRLERECAFRRIDCDGLVEEALAPQLKALGYSGIQDVAKWMGFPYDPQYPTTSSEFIRCQREVMEGVIATLTVTPENQPMVVDTCGSVIYTGAEVCQALQKLTKVIYLEASLEHRQSLFELYLANPKPVIWGTSYQPREYETPQAALSRCYPELLQSRAALYSDLAHRTIPYSQHRQADVSPVTLLMENI